MLAHQRRVDGGVLYHSDWSRRAAGIPVCHSSRDLINPRSFSCPLDEPRRHNPRADWEGRQLFQEIQPLSPRERFRQLFEYLQTDDPFRLTAGYQALGGLVGAL
jgi:hypothetical protein